MRTYAAHFERRENGNDSWMSAAANDRELRQIAVYLAKQPDMEPVAEEIMAAFFADPWARANRWPLKRLAKDPSRFRTRNGNGHVSPATPSDPLEARQAALEGELAKERLKANFKRVGELENEIRAVAAERRRLQ